MTSLRTGEASGVQLAVAILAGGSGRRLSPNKPLLEVGGKPLIQRVVDAMAEVELSPVIVTNDPQAYTHLGLPTATDREAGLGPLGGIQTALEATGAAAVLALAADLPFLQPALLRALAARAGEADCVIAEWNSRLQPLHAVYAQACSAPIAAMLGAGEMLPLDLYPRIRTEVLTEAEVAALDPRGLSFFNINTPDDLEEARRMAAAGASSRADPP